MSSFLLTNGKNCGIIIGTFKVNALEKYFGLLRDYAGWAQYPSFVVHTREYFNV